MVAITRLGLYGSTRQPAGPFAGKVETIPGTGHPVDEITRLGLYGGARALTGSFLGKLEDGEVVGHPVGNLTRLGLYGGSRSRYGAFAGKAVTVATVEHRTYDRYRTQALQEDEEILILLQSIIRVIRCH